MINGKASGRVREIAKKNRQGLTESSKVDRGSAKIYQQIAGASDLEERTLATLLQRSCD